MTWSTRVDDTGQLHSRSSTEESNVAATTSQDPYSATTEAMRQDPELYEASSGSTRPTVQSPEDALLLQNANPEAVRIQHRTEEFRIARPIADPSVDSNLNDFTTESHHTVKNQGLNNVFRDPLETMKSYSPRSPLSNPTKDRNFLPRTVASSLSTGMPVNSSSLCGNPAISPRHSYSLRTSSQVHTIARYTNYPASADASLSQARLSMTFSSQHASMVPLQIDLREEEELCEEEEQVARAPLYHNVRGINEQAPPADLIAAFLREEDEQMAGAPLHHNVRGINEQASPADLNAAISPLSNREKVLQRQTLVKTGDVLPRETVNPRTVRNVESSIAQCSDEDIDDQSPLLLGLSSRQHDISDPCFINGENLLLSVASNADVSRLCNVSQNESFPQQCSDHDNSDFPQSLNLTGKNDLVLDPFTTNLDNMPLPATSSSGIPGHPLRTTASSVRQHESFPLQCSDANDDYHVNFSEEAVENPHLYPHSSLPQSLPLLEPIDSQIPIHALELSNAQPSGLSNLRISGLSNLRTSGLSNVRTSGLSNVHQESVPDQPEKGARSKLSDSERGAAAASRHDKQDAVSRVPLSSAQACTDDVREEQHRARSGSLGYSAVPPSANHAWQIIVESQDVKIQELEESKFQQAEVIRRLEREKQLMQKRIDDFHNQGRIDAVDRGVYEAQLRVYEEDYKIELNEEELAKSESAALRKQLSTLRDELRRAYDQIDELKKRVERDEQREAVYQRSGGIGSPLEPD